jgi:hypothetical protein
MQQFNLKKILKYLFSRIVAVYIGFFLLSLTFIDYPRVHRVMLAMHLNHFRPESFLLIKQINESQDRSNLDIPKGDVHYLINYYEDVLKTFPNQPDSGTILALLYDYLQQPAKVKQYTELAYRYGPPVGVFGYNFGLILHRNGQYEQSNKVLLDTIKRNKPYMIAYFMNRSFLYKEIIGTAYKNQFDFVSCIKEINASTYILILENLAHLKKYQDLYNLSLALFENDFPYKNILHYYAGIGAYSAGDHHQAINHFETFAVSTDEIYADIAFYLSQSYLYTGNTQLAKDYFNKIVPLINSNKETLPSIAASMQVRFL